ncbi:MAG: FlgD immunoglobulin-like domain containing protein [Candidatus Hydrothermia bacterium]
MAVGDLIPYFVGNEVYVAGKKIYMVYHLPGYVRWRVDSIYNDSLSLVHSMAIGDVDTTNFGIELVLVHGGTNYQVSVWSLDFNVIDRFIVDGKAWRISSSWTPSIVNNPADVDVGDVLDVGPADEVVIASGWAGSSPTPSYLFWIDGQGNAYKYALPEPTSTQAECGVFVGNINKYCDRKQEFVLTGGNESGRVVLYQERFLDISVDSIYPDPHVFKAGQNATFFVEVKNHGNINVDSFSLDYVHKNQHKYDGSYTFSGVIYPSKKVTIPINIQYNFLGCDTVNFIADTTGDQNVGNNTRNFVFEVWSDSTLAASLFNSSYFPPAGWSVTREQNVDSVWGWYDTCIVVPYLEIPEGDNSNDTLSTKVLEGAGCAGYPFFYIEEGSSRLITNPFVITGNSRKRIVSGFYMLHSYSAFVEGFNDTIKVEVFDGANFIPKGFFTRELPQAAAPYCSWEKHEVVLGDYAHDVTLRVAFNAISGFGGYSYIDSFWIFATAPGPEFDFNVSSDVGKFRTTDNYWVRIKPKNSSYGIDSAFIYYQHNNGLKEYTKSLYDSVNSDVYYYFTLENPTPSQNHSISFYFEFYDDSPWKYANRYPETGEINYQILPISNELPTSFAFAVLKSNLSPEVFHLKYALPEPSSVDICVYSINGQKVATLVKGNKGAGYYDLKWNGKSDTGSKLPAGVYIVKMLTPKKTFSEKIIISR